MKPLEYYIALYEKHTGEEFGLNDNFTFHYHPEHGFCEYCVYKNCLYIWQMCGELKYWIDLAYKTCQKFDIPKICSYIVRKPRPFIRALGFKVYRDEDRNGDIKYWATNKQDEELTATPIGDRYIFTWEVKLGV